MSETKDFQVNKVRQQLQNVSIANGQLKNSPLSLTNPMIPEISINSSTQSNTPIQQRPTTLNIKLQTQQISIQQQQTITTIVDPKEVGHNIFILAHQLSRHSEELALLLNPDNTKNEMTKTALIFYRDHTAQIEV